MMSNPKVSVSVLFILIIVMSLALLVSSYVFPRTMESQQNRYVSRIEIVPMGNGVTCYKFSNNSGGGALSCVKL